MIKFTPYYTVSYQGEFHKAGDSFYISPADIEIMKWHGKIEESENVPDSKEQLKVPEKINDTSIQIRKAGRPKKA